MPTMKTEGSGNGPLSAVHPWKPSRDVSRLTTPSRHRLQAQIRLRPLATVQCETSDFGFETQD